MSEPSKAKRTSSLLNTRIYIAVSGHRIEYTPSVDEEAFLTRLETMLKDTLTSKQSMLAVAYSAENPIMDTECIPGHGMVTKKVFRNPVYFIMNDIIFRKKIIEEKIDVEKIAARFSLTVQQAADRLRVHHTTLRQAIKARYIATWVKDGHMYLKPDSVDAYKKTRTLRQVTK